MTKVEEMWEALTAYQPQAVTAGHGESWAKMCREKTYAAAADAAYAAYAYSYVAYAYAYPAAAAYAAAAYAYAADDAAAQECAQKAIKRINKVLIKSAQQEPVAKVCHDLDGHIGWNPNLRQLPDEGTTLYTSLPTLSLAQRPHECSRSHPHENMDAMCELRTEIARLTNENARLKAMHQNDEINTYRMTLLCIRDGLQQGMSKSIQKLQAREINDVLGLPSFASYRTSPPAQRTWVGLTNEEIQELRLNFATRSAIYAIEAKLKEKNT